VGNSLGNIVGMVENGEIEYREKERTRRKDRGKRVILYAHRDPMPTGKGGARQDE